MSETFITITLVICFIYIFMFVTLADIIATKIGNYLLNDISEENF
jgi:hypothetical protein